MQGVSMTRKEIIHLFLIDIRSKLMTTEVDHELRVNALCGTVMCSLVMLVDCYCLYMVFRQK